MLLATARFVITTIQRKFLYFFVFFFPKVPRSLLAASGGRPSNLPVWRRDATQRSGSPAEGAARLLAASGGWPSNVSELEPARCDPFDLILCLF